LYTVDGSTSFNETR